MRPLASGGAVLLALSLAACAPGGNTFDDGGAEGQSTWFDQAQFDLEDEQRNADFEGDPAKPYLQYLPGDMVPAGEYQIEGPGKVCFANASLSNTWRQTGWITMNEQAKVLQESGIVSEMETRDAQDSDDTQVADIDYFVNEGDCDGFIISPYSPDATTAAVERACETGKPVIVFDRKVNSDCPTTFIHSVGGMAWGMDSAGFIADRLSDGGRVVALRTAPGVDVFESRWAAAQKIFDDAGIEYTDYLTGAEPAEIKKALTDEIAKGEIDAVWVDLGDQSVPAIEAFEDAGVDVPIVTGEDNMSYLRAWDERGIDGFASVYSAFQWRTAILALSELWQGNEIPEDWVVPQVPITSDELEETLSINEGMPDSHSASFGGEDLPSFPGPWQNREM
ncbi:substrate-binding domain-containing protein [Microbacterium sp. KNMS]